MDTAHEPSRYEIRLQGRLDERWTPLFDGLTLDREPDGVTVLRGRIVDQAALHGLLARLRDLGVPLISVAPEATNGQEPRQSTTAAAPVLDRLLRTERLVLRPATVEETEATWTFRQLESVNAWLTGCPPDLDAYRQLFTDPDRLATTVVIELVDGPVIGDFMLRREDAWAQLDVARLSRGVQAELGWVLDPAHTGHGYATEAVRELLRYCFEDLGVRRVVANCFLANDASWRLMERVGMRREVHAVRESLHRSGRWLDTVGYALLSDEWFNPDRRM